MVRYSACVLSFPIVFSEMGGDYAIESVCFLCVPCLYVSMSVCLTLCHMVLSREPESGLRCLTKLQLNSE